MPPIKCTPCRVRVEGIVYHIHSNGEVFHTVTGGDPYWQDHGAALPEHLAKPIRKEASRLRRNRNARHRSQAMKDLGLRRAHGGAFGGWE